MADEKILEKDGKYYAFFFDQTNGGFHIIKSKDFHDYYAKEDGTLAANEWILVYEPADKVNYNWRYYGAEMKNVKGYQTINGKKYYKTNCFITYRSYHFDNNPNSCFCYRKY